MTKVITFAGLMTILLSWSPGTDSPVKINASNKIDWIYQVDSLLMPFWMSEEALGDPPGNYSAYRYNNGSVIDPATFDFNNIPAYVAPFILGPSDSLRRDFIRIRSRQVYGYCVAFHLTGNEDYLLNAKLGLDYLIQNDVYKDRSAVTFWQYNKATPGIFQRNTQDLAYALLGPAMYYYLTRDNEILDIILSVKRFMWSEYFEKSKLQENSQIMSWVKQDFEKDSTHHKELLAPLDQLNAYLLLMTTVVPDTIYEEFLDNVKALAYSMKDNFYEDKYNIFWGNLNNKEINEGQSDFGHSIKSFWMIYTAARLTGDEILEKFASDGAIKLLQTAFIKEDSRWASKYLDKSLAPDKAIFAWQFAEMDQMCATLSFADTSLYSRYLLNTYPYWEEKMIDHKYKETHWGRDANNNIIDVGFKAGWYKSSFHSLEHALIGYLSTANYFGDNITLYYAFNREILPEKANINPYYFNAQIKKMTESEFENPLFTNLLKTRVTFNNIN